MSDQNIAINDLNLAIEEAARKYASRENIHGSDLKIFIKGCEWVLERWP